VRYLYVVDLLPVGLAFPPLDVAADEDSLARVDAGFDSLVPDFSDDFSDDFSADFSEGFPDDSAAFLLLPVSGFARESLR
jgi:hypothetical protein